MLEKTELFLRKNERWVLIVLFLLFLAINLQGITWGLPSWYPDEIARQVNWALEGHYQFDTEDFTYPSLPKYVMYGIGKITYGLGYPIETFFLCARILSVILGGFVIILTCKVVLAAKLNHVTALIASLLAMTCNELSFDSHLAHVDIYETLFVLVAVYTLIRYHNSSNRLWMYASFFSIGLAASSKYTGGALLLAAYIVYLMTEGRTLFKDLLQTAEKLFISTLLAFLGFALGTPKALLWIAWYFKRVIDLLGLVATYEKQPTSAYGIISQWEYLRAAVGLPMYYLFLIALSVILVILILRLIRSLRIIPEIPKGIIVIFIAVIVLDIPMMISFNVQRRYFLPLIPLMAILSAFLVTYLINLIPQRFKKASLVLVLGALIVIVMSATRVASVILLLKNDARIPAGEFLSTLPEGTSIEYTLYSPYIPEDHFSRAHSYPLYFKKFPDAVLPTDPRFTYNTGEAGIEQRKTDYLVIDSLIYKRFEDEYTCGLHQAECDFFRKLLAGESNYQLIADFKYKLPPYLPPINLVATNPEIRIYQRTNE